MKFYGRTKEIDILHKIRNNSNESAQFTVVTGRRRIGKTELIREAFGDSPYLYFDRTATFYEVKRNPESISLPALEAKRDAFLRTTGEYAGWSLASQGLSLADM